MNFISISDIHIRSSADERYSYLLRFLDKGQSFERIFLLGDIFDVMAGNDLEYQQEFREYFHKLRLLLEKNKTIYIIEGNHDFQLEDLYRQQFSKFMSLGKLIISQEAIILREDNRRYYLSHGDEINYAEEIYFPYKLFLKSGFAGMVANYYVPNKIKNYLAHKFSYDTRSGNDRYEIDETKRQTILDQVNLFIESLSYDYYVTGHNHVEYQGLLGSKIYLNNGYIPHSSKYVCCDEQSGLRLESI